MVSWVIMECGLICADVLKELAVAIVGADR
jgi:hypothetical protein